jgi:hypothetical protein
MTVCAGEHVHSNSPCTVTCVAAGMSLHVQAARAERLSALHSSTARRNCIPLTTNRVCDPGAISRPQDQGPCDLTGTGINKVLAMAEELPFCSVYKDTQRNTR